MTLRWILPFAILLFCHTAGGQELRTWTSASGKTLEAAFVELRHGHVVLQPPEGDPIQIKLYQLSREDQLYISNQSRPTGAPGRPEAVASAPIPPELEALFGKRLVNAKGKKVSPAELAGKKIGLYFSASWCPPCRAFTPQLVAAYDQLHAEGKPFEVVLVTSDKTSASMKKYMKNFDMPWLAIPFGKKQIGAIKKKYGHSGIPRLIVIDDAGQTLSAQARGQVAQKGANAYDAW